MNERPQNLKDWEVRAILDGRKTQMRRVVQGVRYWGDDYDKRWRPHVIGPNSSGEFTWWEGPSHGPSCYHTACCPFGRPGDRLWVRECLYINDYRGLKVPKDEQEDCEIFYRASGLPDLEGEESLIKWTPSIHMPRWASRITLEITAVRVERLQDISSADCKAEGFEWCVPCDEKTDAARDKTGIPQTWYRELWQSIYGAESWQSNPWVWVVGFRRVQ